MKNTFLFLLAILLLWTNATNAVARTSDNKPIVRFGLIADIQYGDHDTNIGRYYRHSLQKLDDCVADLNALNVDFTVNLGDLFDRNPADLDPVMLRLKKLNKKLYNTTGNHDYKGFDNNKLLYKKVGMPAEYYSIEKKGWRIIILNTNEVSAYANIKGTEKEPQLARMKESIKARNRNNGADYNGGISDKQLGWLREQLTKSKKKKQQVIVCTHHPLYPEFGLTALNDKEILDVIAQYQNVKLILSGHHHAGEFAYFSDIPCVTAEGMIETQDNAYGVIEIYTNKILLLGKGRMTSREFDLK